MKKTKTLWILRHGDASFEAPKDSLRQLSERGLAQIKSQADYLTQQAIKVDEVWVSPYLRAQQSSQQLIKYWQHDKVLKTLDLLSPESSLPALLEYLSENAPENLMLVSHQPLVNALLSMLCVRGHLNKDIQFMKTASLACIESELWCDNWAEVTLFQHV